MGLTQHKTGVANVQMVANLLLLGGHIGKPGAGILPVRGHSNVQGQRTVGITEKPEMVPLDKLKALYDFDAAEGEGPDDRRDLQGPDRRLGEGHRQPRRQPAARGARRPAHRGRAGAGAKLSVQIATKLNRSHVVHGEVAYLLPCLGRIEIDRQGGVEQAVSMEDSTGCMHGSRGVAEPASDAAAVGAGDRRRHREGARWRANARCRGTTGSADYAKVRRPSSRPIRTSSRTSRQRMWQPGGFHRPLPACHREWKTPTGKANFICPPSLDEDDDMTARGPDVIRLTTLRSFDQFNTTVYGNHDRFRGIHGTRHVLMMNDEDIARLGFADGQLVRATTASTDGAPREVGGLRIVRYDIPRGCAAGYFPELNPLVPLWHHAVGSQVPAYKAIPIRLSRM